MMLFKRLITTVLLMFALLLPTMAQQKADTTYTFRFMVEKDMFYVPWSGNDTELARLLECIEKNKTTILNGRLPLLVDGYCNSLGSEAENLATAKIRANRVKSELIIRAEIKEENFITRNHATEGDFVTVRLTVPVKETAATDAEAEARRKEEAERLADEKRAEQERLAEEQRKAEEARPNILADTPSETKITNDYHLSLRANLLRWATLTPDLGLEWRICPSWGIAVTDRGLHGRGATKTAAMHSGKWLRKCVTIWARRKPGIWVRCSRPDSSTTSSPKRASRAT